MGSSGFRAMYASTSSAERSRERFDEVGGRLPRSLAARAGAARGDLNLVAGRLHRDLLDQRITRLSEQLSAVWRIAELAHPDKPLERGFARVTTREGRTLIHARDAREAKLLTLRFGDGELPATVDGVPTSPPAPVERKSRKSYIAPQPGLFDGPDKDWPEE